MFVCFEPFLTTPEYICDLEALSVVLQLSFLLVTFNRYYGEDKLPPPKLVEEAGILHWNGPRKPWNLLAGRGSEPHAKHLHQWFQYYDSALIGKLSADHEVQLYENI